MGEVDPSDDDIVRHVVTHYAYDPERRERRHRIVAAFSERQEARALFDRLSADLEGKREGGQAVDPQEHFTAMTLEVGYARFQSQARLLHDAQRRGVSADAVASRLGLPSAEAVLASPRPRNKRGWFRRMAWFRSGRP